MTAARSTESDNRSITQTTVVKAPDAHLNPYKPLSQEIRESILSGDISKAAELHDMYRYIHHGE